MTETIIKQKSKEELIAEDMERIGSQLKILREAKKKGLNDQLFRESLDSLLKQQEELMAQRSLPFNNFVKYDVQSWTQIWEEIKYDCKQVSIVKKLNARQRAYNSIKKFILKFKKPDVNTEEYKNKIKDIKKFPSPFVAFHTLFFITLFLDYDGTSKLSKEDIADIVGTDLSSVSRATTYLRHKEWLKIEHRHGKNLYIPQTIVIMLNGLPQPIAVKGKIHKKAPFYAGVNEARKYKKEFKNRNNVPRQSKLWDTPESIAKTDSKEVLVA